MNRIYEVMRLALQMYLLEVKNVFSEHGLVISDVTLN